MEKIQSQINKVEKSDKINNKNKHLILSFLKKCQAQGLSERRIAKLIWVLRAMSEMIDFEYDKATKENIEGLVAEINQLEMSSWTKADYKKILKKFFKMMFSDGLEIPKLVSWISVKVEDKYQEKKRIQGLIRPEHIETMIRKAPNTMYQALVRFLFETGARISEVIGDPEYPDTGIRIKDIRFDGDMVDVILTGKTGTREISIYDSVPLITTWLNQHPCKDNKNAFLFTCKPSGERLSYQAVCQTIKRIKKRAGLDIDVNPHAFRRASITYFSDFLTSSQLCQKYGLVPGSDVIQHYEYRNPKQLKSAIMKMHGLNGGGNNGNMTKPLECPRCHGLLDASAKQCIGCGQVLEAVSRIDRRKKQAVNNFVMTKIIEADPEIKKRIQELSNEISNRFRKDIDKIMEKC